MAILFMEGFDGHASADEVGADPRISRRSATDSYYVLSTGRGGSGQSIKLSYYLGGFHIVPQTTSSDSIWIQMASKPEVSYTTEVYLALFYSSDGVLQGYLQINTSMNLEYRRGDGTLLGTSSSGVTAGTWHFIELEVTINNSTGTVLLKLDNVTVLNLSSQDTLNSGNADVASIRVGGGASNSTVDLSIDDVVFGDDTGTDATATLGDCTIELLSPDGAGNYTQWTPSTGSNYQNVDDGATNDGDTTYNSSSTAGQKDTFTFDNMSVSSGSVYAVQVTNISRKESGGGRTFRGMIRTSATDASGTSIYVPDSYTHTHDIFENDAGGSDWTVSSVNSAEIGYELVT